MAAESGNYVNDLIPTAPAGSESRSFGDDHIRLIKRTLVNTFAGFPGIVIVTGDESSGGSANEFVVLVSPAPAAYTNRMMVSFLATHNNAGDATIRIGSLPAVPFVANDGAALAADTVKNGSEVLAVYDGSRFRLVATSNVQPLPPDELPNQAGHEGQFLSTDGAVAAWRPLTILRNSQASGYTLLQSDLTKLIYWIGSSTTFIGIVPASALGSGWYCYVKNAGTATVTIDPTGSETINGQATLTLQPLQGVMLQCNGSNFVTLEFNQLPATAGHNGQWLTTDGNVAQWQDLPSSSLPPQAGHSGEFLSTDGVTGVWEPIVFPPNELPAQAGQGGMFLTTNGVDPSWEPIPAELPPQTGNDGRILSTDGIDPLWIDAPTGGGGGGVEELPPQAGQAGRFLQTNGTDPAWALVPNELPSQVGQDGAFLSTNGTNPIWSSVPSPAPELPPQSGHAAQFLTTNGTDPSWAVVPPTPPELPAQAGNNGRVLSTDGTNPAWIVPPTELPPQSGNANQFLQTNGASPVWANIPAELPSQAGNSGKVLTTDGSIASWSAPVSNVRVLPVFDPTVTQFTPGIGGDTIPRIPPFTYTGGGTSVKVSYNSVSGLFIATGTTAINGNFYTSPDGLAWTAKPITFATSVTWSHVSSGANVVAAHSHGTATGTLRSTDGGVTWVAGGNLPAAPGTGAGPLVGFGTTFILQRGTSTIHHTQNAGVSWTSQTQPTTTTSSIFAINNLFVAYTSGTTYYTSATGLTGSWTARTLPATPISTDTMVLSPDGLYITYVGSLAGTVIFETSDGINWTNTGVNVSATGGSYELAFRIGTNMYYVPGDSSDTYVSAIYINGMLVSVRSKTNVNGYYSTTNGNGTYVFTNTSANLITINNSTTGLFY